MSEQPKITCRNCKFWKPLFSGEHWGVRSFVDAPAEVQAEIKAKLTKASNEHLQVYEVLDESYGDIHGDLDTGQITGIPNRIDWPEWGDCILTDRNEEASKTSLARAMDGSNYLAVLRCHADFGCVQAVEYTKSE